MTTKMLINMATVTPTSTTTSSSKTPTQWSSTSKTLLSVAYEQTTAVAASAGNAAGMQIDDEEQPDLITNQLVQIFFCLLYTTVFVLGVFGNVLVCYVVLRNRAMQTVTNIFITNLALSDILLCVLAVPFTPLYTFMGRWAFGRTLCHLVSFAQGCSIYISTLTLTSIAIDRYFVIIYPFHPRMKLSTCIAIIVSIWVIAVLATLPYGMYMKVVIDSANTFPAYNVSTTSSSIMQQQQQQQNILSATLITTINTTYTMYTAADETIEIHQFDEDAKTYCEENWPSEQYRKVFGSVTTILQFVLPFVIISICYIWVSIKLNARARAKPGSKSSQREEADRDRKKHTNRMLIAMVAVFGLSWLPLNVVNIYDDFYVNTNEWRFYTLLFFVAHSIAMSSTCYNIFLYAWLNENFRKEFKHVLPCFNPSNRNIAALTRGIQRSDQNFNAQRLQGVANANPSSVAAFGANSVGTDCAQDEANNIQLYMPCTEVLIVPPHDNSINQNDSGSATSLRQVNILLNDNTHLKAHAHLLHTKRHDNNTDMDSTDEHTSEVRFSETPFVSSDNTTGISNLDASNKDAALLTNH